MKFAKVMFSQVSVCPQGVSVSVQGGLSPGGVSVHWSLSRGISVQVVSVQGVSVQGVFVQGDLCPGGLSRGSLCVPHTHYHMGGLRDTP